MPPLTEGLVFFIMCWFHVVNKAKRKILNSAATKHLAIDSACSTAHCPACLPACV